jgi:hypothetical protein
MSPIEKRNMGLTRVSELAHPRPQGRDNQLRAEAVTQLPILPARQISELGAAVRLVAR